MAFSFWQLWRRIMPDKRFLIFPLGGVVLFPGMLMPLHIFEPRYKALLERALNEEGMITMALIRPDQKRESHEHESVFNVAAEGEVIHYQKLEDGTFNIVLEGRHRVLLGDEKYEDLVRVFEGEVLEDEIPQEEERKVQELCDQIYTRVETWVNKKLPPSVHEKVLERIQEAKTVGSKLDRMSSFAIHSVANRQVILQTHNVLKRANIVENLTRWAGIKDYYDYVNLN
jgi:Lon protease-like protein